MVYVWKVTQPDAYQTVYADTEVELLKPLHDISKIGKHSW